MVKNEAKFQTRFGTFLKTKWTEGTAVFELKFARGTRMQFSQIKPHQLVALRLVSNKSLYFKIPDTSYSPLPFDCFFLVKQPAYFAIMFEENKSCFYLLSIEQIDGLIYAGNKSITLDDCERLGRKFQL